MLQERRRTLPLSRRDRGSGAKRRGGHYLCRIIIPCLMFYIRNQIDFSSTVFQLYTSTRLNKPLPQVDVRG